MRMYSRSCLRLMLPLEWAGLANVKSLWYWNIVPGSDVANLSVIDKTVTLWDAPLLERDPAIDACMLILARCVYTLERCQLAHSKGLSYDASVLRYVVKLSQVRFKFRTRIWNLKAMPCATKQRRPWWGARWEWEHETTRFQSLSFLEKYGSRATR